MTVRETVNATKERYGEAELGELFAGAKTLIACKGKKITKVALAKLDAAEAHAELVRLALGPTGNLRAPTLRLGKTWLVGFHEEEYSAAFG